MRIELILVMPTVSESNCTMHWTKKYKRHEAQKTLIRLAMRPHIGKIQLPCVVTFTRYSPKSLDTDNLCSAFKFLRDELSDCIIHGHKVTKKKGMSDNHPKIKWEYAQEKGKYGTIKIEIEYD